MRSHLDRLRKTRADLVNLRALVDVQVITVSRIIEDIEKDAIECQSGTIKTSPTPTPIKTEP